MASNKGWCETDMTNNYGGGGGGRGLGFWDVEKSAPRAQ